MKKLLFIFLLLISATSYGQWTLSGAKNRWGNGMAFSTVDTSRFAASVDSILFQVNRAGRPVFKYTGVWNVLAYSSDLQNYLTWADTGRANGELATAYALNKVRDSLQTNINGKLNISDTAAMLVNLLRKSDTSNMLSGYLRTGNAKNGTVTSIATNNGTGLTGGTITNTGTLANDTTILSTRAWRVKGTDSLSGAINLQNPFATPINFVYNQLSSVGFLENSAYVSNDTVYQWYCHTHDTTTAILLHYTKDYGATWSTPVSTNLFTMFPEIEYYNGSYYATGTPDEKNVFLYKSTDKTTWVKQNGNQPIATASTDTTNWAYYVYNTGFQIVNDTVHALIEGSGKVGAGYYGTNGWMGYAKAPLSAPTMTLTPKPQVLKGGNADMHYIPERNAFLVLHSYSNRNLPSYDPPNTINFTTASLNNNLYDSTSWVEDSTHLTVDSLGNAADPSLVFPTTKDSAILFTNHNQGDNGLISYIPHMKSALQVYNSVIYDKTVFNLPILSVGAGLSGGGILNPGKITSIVNTGVLSLAANNHATVSGSTGNITIGTDASPSYGITTIVSRDGAGGFSAGDIAIGTVNFNSNNANTVGAASGNKPANVHSYGYTVYGSSSGAISINPQAAAGTYNFNLPITEGTSGYILKSQGGGSTAMIWADPNSLGSVTATSVSSSGAITATSVAVTGGVSTQLLQADGGQKGYSSSNTVSNIVARDASGDFNAHAVSLTSLSTSSAIVTTNFSTTGATTHTGNSGQNVLTVNASGSAAAILTNQPTTSEYSMYMNVNGTQAGTITHPSSSTTNYNTSSDYRLKTNIKPIGNVSNIIMNLRPSKWIWKKDGSDGEGFIAHEVQALIPLAVSGKKDELDSIGNPKYQSMDASKLIPYMVSFIQEQQKQIDELKAILQRNNIK